MARQVNGRPREWVKTLPSDINVLPVPHSATAAAHREFCQCFVMPMIARSEQEMGVFSIAAVQAKPGLQGYGAMGVGQGRARQVHCHISANTRRSNKAQS